MATASVTQLRSIGVDGAGHQIPVPDSSSIVLDEVVTFSTAAQSTAFQSNTKIIRVCSDTACRIAFGANPVATAGNLFLPAGIPEYWVVSPGDKISIVAA